MPLYEFQCDSCGRVREEYRQSMGDDDPGDCCEACGGPMARIPSTCLMQDPLLPRPHDRAKDIWEGTALADSDGINRAHYVSDKAQFDLGSSAAA